MLKHLFLIAGTGAYVEFAISKDKIYLITTTLIQFIKVKKCSCFNVLDALLKSIILVFPLVFLNKLRLSSSLIDSVLSTFMKQYFGIFSFSFKNELRLIYVLLLISFELISFLKYEMFSIEFDINPSKFELSLERKLVNM